MTEKELSQRAKQLKFEREARGWTQRYVAEQLGVEVHTVGRWERGLQKPRPEQIQNLIALYEKKDARELYLIEDDDMNNIGSTHPENTALVILADPAALSDIVTHPEEQKRFVHQRVPKIDWGEAPSIEHFSGRGEDLLQLEQSINQERYRLIVVLAMGGMGKTMLVTQGAHNTMHGFDYVIWRSLQHAPRVEELLEDCLQFFTDRTESSVPEKLPQQLSLLLACLQKYRCLLVFDNVESVFDIGQRAGSYAEQYRDYRTLFERIGGGNHQSCLLLTSREEPQGITRQAGVRLFPLQGMTVDEGKTLLEEKQLRGNEAEWTQLINLYRGNPLALKLAADLIGDIYASNIQHFLQEEEFVVTDIRDLLEQQFERLNSTERLMMYWLAVEREAVTLEKLRHNVYYMLPGSEVRPAIESLQRRSLIERQDTLFALPAFTLQPVVGEYILGRLVNQASTELLSQRCDLLGSLPLLIAQAPDYIRQSQRRQLLDPICEQLHIALGRQGTEQCLKDWLVYLRNSQAQKYAYAAGTILNLLVNLHVDLRGIDCSRLTVWQAYLQGYALPESNFASSDLSTSVFTDTFSSILCTAVSGDGQMLAVGTTTNELRLWHLPDLQPLYICSDHTDGIRSVAFDPTGRLIASGSEDQTIRLYETESGTCVAVLTGHTDWVRSLAFSPDGKWLVSGSEDTTVRLWSIEMVECRAVLQGHTKRVRIVTFHPQGNCIASGSDDGLICLWSLEDCLQGNNPIQWQAHNSCVRTLVFYDDTMLISGGEDHMIRLWDITTRVCLTSLEGHTHRISALALAYDQQLLASSSDDHTIRLWNLRTFQCERILQDHTNRIWSLSLVPYQTTLISASEDQTLRLWDTATGRCYRVLQGDTSLIKAVAFSPDGSLLVDGTEEQSVLIWDVASGAIFKSLAGHLNRVRTVAFSPSGQIVATGSEDETIRLWDVQKGALLYILRGHTHLVRAVCFSPDGDYLVSCSYDGTIQLWQVATGKNVAVLYGHNGIVWSITWSADGDWLISGGDDRTIRVWAVAKDSKDKEAIHAHCYATWSGHTHKVWSVACSPDSQLVASAADDRTVRVWHLTTGECLWTFAEHTAWTRTVVFCGPNKIASGSHDRTIRIWNIDTGHCEHILTGHNNAVWSLDYYAGKKLLASGSDDGTVRIWHSDSGVCQKMFSRERLYERMNIAGTQGLSEAQRLSLKELGAIEVDEAFF